MVLTNPKGESAKKEFSPTSTILIPQIWQLGTKVIKKRKRLKMPSATSIVARSYPDRIIGIENTLPWHIKSDLKLFRQRTEGHAVIMGRKTFESIGKPLPRRLNIILSRETIADAPNVKWAKNPETALLIADTYSICNLKKQFFVIGGEKIYDLFFDFINKVYLTDVFSGNINGDAKFDYEFLKDQWIIKDEVDYPKKEGDDFPFRVSCYLRRKPFHRYESVSRLKKSDPEVAKFLDRYESLDDELDQLILQSSNVEESQSLLF